MHPLMKAALLHPQVNLLHQVLKVFGLAAPGVVEAGEKEAHFWMRANLSLLFFCLGSPFWPF